MKKTSAIILLIICCLPALFVAGLFNTIAISLTRIAIPGGEFLCISHAVIMSLGISLAVNRVQKLFREKYGIIAPLFLTLAYAPAIVLNTVVAIIFIIHFPESDRAVLYTAYLTGMGAILLAAAMWQLVLSRKSKKEIPSEKEVAVMPKGAAIALLIVGMMVVSFTLIFLNFLAETFGSAVGGTQIIGYAIAAAMTFAVAFGIDRVRLVFRKKYAMNSIVFWVLAYVPSLAVTVGFTIYIESLRSWLGGFVTYVYYYVIPRNTAIFAAAGAFWTIVSIIAGKVRSSKAVSE